MVGPRVILLVMIVAGCTRSAPPNAPAESPEASPSTPREEPEDEACELVEVCKPDGCMSGHMDCECVLTKPYGASVEGQSCP